MGLLRLNKTGFTEIKGYKHTYTFYVHINHKDVMAWLNIKFLLEKISLYPHIVEEGGGIRSDIARTLTKLNSTPIIVNHRFNELIRNMFGGDLRNIMKVLGVTTLTEQKAVGQQYLQFITTLGQITQLLKKYGLNHFYMLYTHDFRGRLYPKLNYISQIGPHYARHALIPLHNYTLDMNKVDIMLKGRYPIPLYTSLLSKYLNLANHSSCFSVMGELASLYFKMTNAEIPFDERLVRLYSDFKLLITGQTIIPTFAQIDATCNVIQHISTITGNVDIIEQVGLLKPSLTGISRVLEDFYTASRSKLKLVMQEIAERYEGELYEWEGVKYDIKNVIKEVIEIISTKLTQAQ